MTTFMKVWNSKRDKKVFISINTDNGQLCEQLILNASNKLKTDFSTIVLEFDGTVIEDDEILMAMQKETLMLLTKDERWTSDDLNLSTCSTITVASDGPASRSSSVIVESDVENPETSESTTDSEVNQDIVSENYWDEVFEVPWGQFSQSLIANFEKGTRITEHINRVVVVTVDAIREIKKYPGIKALKTIAKKIVNKYPQEFKDIDDDQVTIGCGYHNLTRKLLERNNYLNRPHKRPLNSSKRIEVAPNKRRLLMSIKAGCVNWQPETESGTPETLDEKKRYLNDSPDDFVLDENFMKFLNDTYTMQRTFINGLQPTINQIKQEWPILLKKDVAFWHFNKLTLQKIDDLDRTFEQKLNKILQFGIEKNIITDIPVPDDDEKYMKCLFILGNYFKEDVNFLIIKLEDKNLDTSECIKLNAPCIVITNEVTENASYHVYIEKQKVLSCENFISSFKALFAFYYNFNMKYPGQVAYLLEFVQRYFLKINPDQGTKGNKKSLTKIVSLINKLRKID